MVVLQRHLNGVVERNLHRRLTLRERLRLWRRRRYRWGLRTCSFEKKHLDQ